MRKRKRNESKSEASSIEEEVSKSEEFSDDEKPSSVKGCPPRRSKRGLTRRATKKHEEKKAVEKYGAPSDRQRRSGTTYANVNAVRNVKRRKPNNFKLEAAKRNKVIWDGFRKGINWSTGFSDQFWDDNKDGNDEWVCAVRRKGTCIVPDPVDSHEDLEIGHKNGFYTKMIDVDPKYVCDGQKHWEVRLVSDIIEANEDVSNLQPQCTKCNRHKNQKKKDEDSFGFQPKELKKCPGKKKCTYNYIITSAGEVERKPEESESDSDNESMNEDSDSGK